MWKSDALLICLLPENGSFTGLLGYVASQKIDYLTYPNLQFIEQDNKIDFSSVLGTDDVIVGHFLDDQEARNTKKNEELFSTLLTFLPSPNILLEFLLLFLFTWLMSLVLFWIARRLNQTNKRSIIPLKIFGSNVLLLRDDLNHQLMPTCLKYSLLINLVLLGFVKIVLSNNIQSSKVVVDKENLLYNENKIYATKMRCCWFAKDNMFDLFKNSKGGLSHFIFWSKTDQENLCILVNEDQSFPWEDNFFSVGFGFKVKMYLRIIGFVQRRSVFYNEIPLFSPLAVIYLSVSASQAIRDAMEKWIVKILEHGWYYQGMRKNFQEARATFPKDDIYSSASEYTKHNTIIKVNLEYENFELFFHSLLFIDLIVALVYFLFRLGEVTNKLKSSFYTQRFTNLQFTNYKGSS